MRTDPKYFKRGSGRPRWSGEKDYKCDVRLSSEENSMLNNLANRNEVSRSTIMRKALRDFYKFNSLDDKKEE